MPVRRTTLAPRRSDTARNGTARSGTARSGTVADAALDDALVRIRELTLRLWAVRAAHQPSRGLGRPRCGTCRARYPCPTLQAVGTQRPQR